MTLPRTLDQTKHSALWSSVYGVGEHVVTARNQLIESGGHDFRRLSASGPDNGGTFRLLRHEYSEWTTYPSNPYPRLNGSFGHWYEGDILLSSQVGPTDGLWPEVHPTNDIQLSAVGTSAIARLSPTNPTADLATFIGELREGLPKLGIESLKARTKRARSAGSDYLNYQFGWKPLVNDIQKLSRAVTQQDKILRQYEQRSGKAVKRKATLADEVTVEMAVQTGIRPGTDVPFWVADQIQGGTLTTTTTTKLWRGFSGTFTYYLAPEKSGVIGRARALQNANKLLGVRLTPEVVWNLVPWSWAADWVFNYGDVLHNVSSFARDGLVMPYAYISEEKSIEVKYELEGVMFPNTSFGAIGPHSFSQTFKTISKTRLPATPFGFGLSPELDFTSRQKAIVVALGLTKGSRRSHRT